MSNIVQGSSLGFVSQPAAFNSSSFPISCHADLNLQRVVMKSISPLHRVKNPPGSSFQHDIHLIGREDRELLLKSGLSGEHCVPACTHRAERKRSFPLMSRSTLPACVRCSCENNVSRILLQSKFFRWHVSAWFCWGSITRHSQPVTHLFRCMWPSVISIS